MDTSIARRNILARIRARRAGRPAPTAAERDAATDYLARHPAGPRPEMPSTPGPRRALHRRSASDFATTVDRSSYARPTCRPRRIAISRSLACALQAIAWQTLQRSAVGRRGPRRANFASRTTATSSVSPAASARRPRPARSCCCPGPRRYASAGAAAGNAHCDRAGFAHRRGARGRVRADPHGAGRTAARGQFRLRAFAHRRYRTDHRARRAWPVSRACDRRAGRLSGSAACHVRAVLLAKRNSKYERHAVDGMRSRRTDAGAGRNRRRRDARRRDAVGAVGPAVRGHAAVDRGISADRAGVLASPFRQDRGGVGARVSRAVRAQLRRGRRPSARSCMRCSTNTFRSSSC